MSCSNLVTNGPAVDTQFVSRHSSMYARSLPCSTGKESGMDTGGALTSNPIADCVAIQIFLYPIERRNQTLFEGPAGPPAENSPRRRCIGAQSLYFAPLRALPFAINGDRKGPIRELHDELRKITD